MKIIILAAGIGSRLNSSFPKSLTMLRNGCSILQTQIESLTRYVDVHDILVVIGFKKELIMEAQPNLKFVYNDYFDTTNTAKSLLKGLLKVKNEDVLWLNGDVVFDHRIIGRITKNAHSCIAVNTAQVGEEEIKYTINDDSSIKEVSKHVQNGIGEAVGINFVKTADLGLFKKCLELCSNNDYFERGIELAIQRGLKAYPVDISDLNCVEIDFIEDIERANSFFEK